MAASIFHFKWKVSLRWGAVFMLPQWPEGKQQCPPHKSSRRSNGTMCATRSSCLCHLIWGIKEMRPLWRWKRQYYANTGTFLVELIPVWSFRALCLCRIPSVSKAQGRHFQHVTVLSLSQGPGSEFHKIILCVQNPVFVIWSWSTPQSVNGEGYNSPIFLIIPMDIKCWGPCKIFLSRTWFIPSPFSK